MKEIKVKMNCWDDRNNMITALANSGHKVWVEEKETSSFGFEKEYFVVFELDNKKK